ncbi:unnamed protein product [Meloidogyne enterolobii]|uniref:Uncharacterized protein n=1 Tax=Meloidogyne enterolobii TaxID=390850 RepID=A0ACB0ZU46_MELEN
MCTYIRLYSHTGQTKEMLYPNEDFEDCNNGFPPKFAICLEKNGLNKITGI